LLSVSFFGFSQNKQILYNFTSIPETLLTNPGADISYKMYIGIPMLSGINFNIGSNSFSAFDVYGNTGVSLDQKLKDLASKMTYNDRISLNEQIDILNAGFKVGGENSKSYVSFGVYQEFDLLAYLPKDLINSAVGNAPVGQINLTDINARAEMLTVFHLGFHKKINKKLVFGFRAKAYSSIFNFNSTHNSGSASVALNGGSGFSYTDFQPSLIVNTSGITKYRTGSTNDLASDLKNKALLGENLGLGFDAGITYYPQKNKQFTASIIDAGYVKHSKEVQNYVVKSGTFLSSYTTIKDFRDAIDKVINPLPSAKNTSSYTTWRPMKVYSSYQYSFDEDRSDVECDCFNFDQEPIYKNALGVQFFAMTTPKLPTVALTGFYKRRVTKALQMKATYTLDTYSYTNIGLGLSTTFGKVNFYLLADNLLAYTDLSKANSLNFQFGLNVIFRNKHNAN
jgi:Family of unknown function (DUF5723)